MTKNSQIVNFIVYKFMVANAEDIILRRTNLIPFKGIEKLPKKIDKTLECHLLFI